MTRSGCASPMNPSARSNTVSISTNASPRSSCLARAESTTAFIAGSSSGGFTDGASISTLRETMTPFVFSAG